MKYKTKEEEQEERRVRHIHGLKLIVQHLEYEIQRAGSPAAALSMGAMQLVADEILWDMESIGQGKQTAPRGITARF